MLGVGFGREHDGQSQSTPDRNPLLHVPLPSGAARGYTLSTRGILVGAPRDASGFTVVPLERDTTDKDWQAPPACITIGSSKPVCGAVLVDTGIAGSFLTVPEDRIATVQSPAAPSTLVRGTRIAIDLASGRSSTAGYAFSVGDELDSKTPANVTLSGIGKRPPFVNTGVRLLNGFDYFFDDSGRVGYRARSSGGH